MVPLLLLLLVTTTAAKPADSQKHTLFVGQIFSRDVSSADAKLSAVDGSTAPDFLQVEDNTFFAVPKSADVGTHIVMLTEPGKVTFYEFRVVEEYTNPCGEMDSFWLDAIFMMEDTASNMFKFASNIFSALNKFGEDRPSDEQNGVYNFLNRDNLRVFVSEYGAKIRNLTSLLTPQSDQEAAVNAEKTFAVVLQIGCVEGNELDQDFPPIGIDLMDYLIDSDDDDADDIQVYRGRMRTRQERGGFNVISDLDTSTSEPEIIELEETTKPVETTTLRITTTTKRAVKSTTQNSPPQRTGQLQSLKCTRGIFCAMIVPNSTFNDAEDGNTSKLRLEIKGNSGDINWVKVQDMQISAVPMETGEFDLRLEARDSAGQMVSAAFSLMVADAPEYTHQFRFDTENRFSKDLAKNPHALTEFTEKVSKAFKSPIESVAVSKVEADSDDHLVIYWSNASLPLDTCAKDDLEAMKLNMAMKKRNNPKNTFLRQMGHRFIVSKIQLDLFGPCIATPAPDSSSPAVVTQSRESGFGWLALAAALALLLLLIAIALFCCLARRPKKERPSEFVSKGLPVVFPEEVADESETAHANTPMLVKEERPPLKVSQHENPLYKPPPPLTSTFSPRSTTPGLAGTPSQQRMPPPYVPP